MALTQFQIEHVKRAFPEFRAQMADYLERKVEVVVYLQNECGGDVPPFAVAPKENQEFWIGCWETAEIAASNAAELGLRVISN